MWPFRRAKAAPPAEKPTRYIPVSLQGTAPPQIHGRLRRICEARRQSYRSANNPRSRVAAPLVGGSGDYHADSLTRRLTRELARDLDRNAGPCQVILDRVEELLVGGCVRARPQSSDADWNHRLADLDHQVMGRVEGGIDARQLRSGYALQGMWARQLATDGDFGVLKLPGLRLQTLESEQIAGGPTGSMVGYSLHEGLEFDPAGAIARIWACPFDPNTGMVVTTAAVDYTRDELIFVSNAKRNSGTRGMPDLTAVLDDFERADSYVESETIAAELSAQIWILYSYPAGQIPNAGAWQPANTAQNDRLMRGGLDQGGSPDWQPTTAGSALTAPNGMKAEAWNPGRPNRDAEPFVQFLLRQYCAVEGYPYEIIFGDLRGMSWSVANQLVGLANATTRRRQERHLQPLFSALYRWRVRHYIAQGWIEDRPDWDKHEHEWPRLPPPNEADYFNAHLVGLQSGQTSLQSLFGDKAFTFLEQRAQEYRHACELARSLRTEYPEFAISPDHFLGGLKAGAAPPVPGQEKTSSELDGTPAGSSP